MSRGRPKLDRTKKRSANRTTRMTAEEDILLEKFAWAESMPVSAAIRTLVVGCLTNSEARESAIEASREWSELDQLSRTKAIGDSAQRYRDEFCLRMSEWYGGEVHKL